MVSTLKKAMIITFVFLLIIGGMLLCEMLHSPVSTSSLITTVIS